MTSQSTQPVEHRSDHLSRPLLTFCLFTYNQTEFVIEAIRAALAQTYQPLEIIISDDASTDETFGCVEEIARNYHGPHQVRLNRNETNLGIGAHVSKVLSMAQGELCVVAAGDDISKPDRVEKLFAAWDGGGRKAGALFSNMQVIDASGRQGNLWCQSASAPYPRTLEQLLEKKVNPVYGCSCAYSKMITTNFGPLHPGVVHEDTALGLRVIASGGYVYLNEALVWYRRHDSNVFKPTQTLLQKVRFFPTARYVEGKRAILEMWAEDLRKIGRPDLMEKYGLSKALLDAELEVRLHGAGRWKCARLIIGKVLGGLRLRRACRLLVQYAILRGL